MFKSEGILYLGIACVIVAAILILVGIRLNQSEE